MKNDKVNEKILANSRKDMLKFSGNIKRRIKRISKKNAKGK